ncbi:MAG: RNA polymerase sigma factor [Ferrovum myxofaciens]|uniref:RNA polymerase sigma factor n=2 Tax=root TaxID=1 RepID=A0A9E6MYS5_9PROT|nr:RNA polymerase sigma factor [Ferrovum myxofaciens]QKE39826.2 MAG: RNA polymerase sigma factor [Ferrovum myxofaciens]QWY76207.1 MAG: RNA polymerase sigma factor [Ferrovum myxofaciens]QWY78868.1 MAG: RNA polymerase sigma factor [Ferrovum myxofaciens]
MICCIAGTFGIWSCRVNSCYHSPLSFAWETPLASFQEISKFLASAERRAFKQAVYAVQDDSAALDVVQDAMLKLTESYSDRPVEELPPLFQRILQNTIRDHYRRFKVRSAWTPLAGSFQRGVEEGDDDFDILDSVEDSGEGRHFSLVPDLQLNQKQTLVLIEIALQNLPPRQREAFLLRYWEERDVAETAQIMGCSEGSVKAHCSRAVHALARVLASQGLNDHG